MTIPKNTPAFVKYLPVVEWDIEPNTGDYSDFMEACVSHGVRYGKLPDEARRTEERCIRLMRDLMEAPGEPHKTLFELRTAYAESAKSRHLWEKYLTGNVVEIGSGGWPMVPHAIQCELSKPTYAHYNSGNEPEFPIQWHSDSLELPFKDNTFDATASSHLLEDFPLDRWRHVLTEWVRIIKPGGYLVVLLPDKQLWDAAMSRGQPPNCAHRHESHVGELSGFAPHLRLEVVEDRLTMCYEHDYSILFIGRKLT